jgi:hypothetical protein
MIDEHYYQKTDEQTIMNKKVIIVIKHFVMSVLSPFLSQKVSSSFKPSRLNYLATLQKPATYKILPQRSVCSIALCAVTLEMKKVIHGEEEKLILDYCCFVPRYTSHISTLRVTVQI